MGRIASRRGFAGSVLMALLVSFAIPAVPAAAEVYHIKLRNGGLIDSAYQPVQAAFDPSLVLLMTDNGNWIGLPQKDIESVQTESQVRGFGVALNFNTVAIGWAPNDLPAETEGAAAQSATMQALQNIMQRQEQDSHYSIPMFATTDQLSGIPARFYGVPPGLQAPVSQSIPIPIPVSAPTAAPAPPAPAAPSGAPAAPNQ